MAPLGLVMAVLMGLAPLVGWKGSSDLPKELRWSALTAAALLVLGLLFGMRDLLLLLFLAAVGLAVGTNVQAFMRSYDRGGIVRAGGYAAHLGVTFMLIAILAQSGGVPTKVDLGLRSPEPVRDMTMTFQGWRPAEGPNGKQAVVVDVEKDGRTFRTYPRIYQVFGNGQWMTRTEPFIHRGVLADLYIAPAQYEPRSIADAGGAEVSLTRGDTASGLGYRFTFDRFEFDPDHMATGENTAWVVLTVERDGRTETVRPALKVTQEGVSSDRVELSPLPDGTQHVVMIGEIDVDSGRVDLLVFDASQHAVDPMNLGGVLTLEVSTKPLMNFLWIGVLMFVLGGLASAWKRTTDLLPRGPRD
jgi:cytochrome c-type biogenesis protein CcmF